MEIRVECITPLLTTNNAKMKVTTNANVLEHNESRVKQSRQNILIPRKWVWSKFVQGANVELKPTLNYYSFCKHEGHVLTVCPFIEKDVWDAIINHFQTKIQTKLDMEKK
jgi:hypothetical protein